MSGNLRYYRGIINYSVFFLHNKVQKNVGLHPKNYGKKALNNGFINHSPRGLEEYSLHFPKLALYHDLLHIGSE